MLIAGRLSADRCDSRAAVPPAELRAAAAARLRIAVGADRCSRLVDWALAGAVLYVLLPAGSAAVPGRSSAPSWSAILIGMASHVPGGVGVFEGLMVLLLKPYLTSASCSRRWWSTARSTTCCRWRGAARPGRRRSAADGARQAARVGAALGRLTEQLTPRVLAVFTFLARPGAALLGRHAGRGRAARAAQPRRAVWRHRGVTFARQRGRRGAADSVARAGAAARRGLLPHRRRRS